MASVAMYPVGQGSGIYEADRWNGPEEWGREEGSWQRESIRPSQCLVRTFPNEDILFWTKPEIDNGRVERQHDPQAISACWKNIGAAAAIVVLSVGLLVPKAYGLLAGMQVERLRARQTELHERLRVARLEQSRLTSPAAIEKLAAELGFEPPSPERVVRLHRDGAAATRNAANR